MFLTDSKLHPISLKYQFLGSYLEISLKLSKATRERGRNVLFNDTLDTFYLQLYVVGHMVKDHSDSERKPAAAT